MRPIESALGILTFVMACLYIVVGLFAISYSHSLFWLRLCRMCDPSPVMNAQFRLTNHDRSKVLLSCLAFADCLLGERYYLRYRSLGNKIIEIKKTLK